MLMGLLNEHIKLTPVEHIRWTIGVKEPVDCGGNLHSTYHRGNIIHLHIRRHILRVGGISTLQVNNPNRNVVLCLIEREKVY